MTLLIEQKTINKQISQDLAKSLIQNAKRRFSMSDFQNHAQGSTYVSFSDMIDIQLFESQDIQTIEMINDKPRTRTRNSRRNNRFDFEIIHAKRSWQRSINLLKTEDKFGYGTQFNTIPIFLKHDISSAFTWSLFSSISSCQELWSIIDQKDSPFRWSKWEGWLLSAIQTHCFKNNIYIKTKDHLSRNKVTYQILLSK